MQLVPSATELGNDVLGKEFGVTAGDIHIHIGEAHKAVQHRFKFVQELHFVQQDREKALPDL